MNLRGFLFLGKLKNGMIEGQKNKNYRFNGQIFYLKSRP